MSGNVVPFGQGLWPATSQKAADLQRGKHYAGLCKHRHCQAPGATFWNSVDQAFFCEACADRINENAYKEDGVPPVCIDQAPRRRRG